MAEDAEDGRAALRRLRESLADVRREKASLKRSEAEILRKLEELEAGAALSEERRSRGCEELRLEPRQEGRNERSVSLSSSSSADAAAGTRQGGKDDAQRRNDDRSARDKLARKVDHFCHQYELAVKAREVMHGLKSEEEVDAVIREGLAV